MQSPKFFSALSLIQSNMYYQKKKCLPEILLDIMEYSRKNLNMRVEDMEFPGVSKK